MKTVKAKNIDEYISGFPEDVQIWLKQLYAIVKRAAPKAEESISYGMPAFKLHGVLIYFGGFKNHIGFYPVSSGIAAFKKELSVYKGAKGSVQFPFDKPLPLTLISKIIKFRVKENMEKAKNKLRIPKT